MSALIFLRITPAWAGKSSTRTTMWARRRDHPRVGWEKVTHNTDRKSKSGSPPRGRGKDAVLVAALLHDRITPAWAGKSPDPEAALLRRWDHPRVGGEKTKKIP